MLLFKKDKLKIKRYVILIIFELGIWFFSSLFQERKDNCLTVHGICTYCKIKYLKMLNKYAINLSLSVIKERKYIFFKNILKIWKLKNRGYFSNWENKNKLELNNYYHLQNTLLCYSLNYSRNPKSHREASLMPQWRF